MVRHPPRLTRIATLFPSTTLFRSVLTQDPVARPCAEIHFDNQFRFQPHRLGTTQIGAARRIGNFDGSARRLEALLQISHHGLREAAADAADVAPGPAIASRLCEQQRTQFGACRSEEHTSELQSLMRISYAVFCLKKKKKTITTPTNQHNN